MPTLPRLTCQRCGYTWTPRVNVVKRCANQNCKSAYWNVPKKKRRQHHNTP